MADTQEAKWYVVHTYSGYENNVAGDLATMVESRGMQDLIQDIKIPTETVTEIKEDKKREVERKIFPGYVLIKMIVTDDSWYVVRNIRGCTGFVGPASKPVPLTDEEVVALGVEKHSVDVGYKEGDNVKIISGPLEGYSGTVKSVDTANNSVCVALSMFGRETPVEFELDQILRLMTDCLIRSNAYSTYPPKQRKPGTGLSCHGVGGTGNMTVPKAFYRRYHE